MNPFLKWGLIATGAYLIFKNVDFDSVLPGASFPPVPAGGNGPGANGATPTVPAVNLPGSVTPSTPVPAAVIDSAAARESLWARAAMGDATAIAQSDAAGFRQNADQWNYWRTKGGGSVTTVDLFPEGARDFMMLVSDYQQRRKTAGLSGLRGWR